MAKALVGHLYGAHPTTARLAKENARLKTRVSELEALILRLKEENDALAESQAEDLRPMLPA